MFSKLLEGWKKHSLVMVAFGDALSMLRKAELMFNSVSDLFLEGKPIDYDIYAVDKEINRGEIDVRRKVLEHLSINPRQDLVFSLVLTTIITDIERIGDYAKNIYELETIYEPIGDTGEYKENLRTSTARVSQMFRTAIVAFETEDQRQAEIVMIEHGDTNRKCEAMIRHVASNSELTAHQAVVLVLYARFLKRVSAHLANVISSVVRPFDRIGFYRDQLPGQPTDSAAPLPGEHDIDEA